MSRSIEMRDMRTLAMALGLLCAVAMAPAVARADHGDCGQPQSRGHKPATTDALVVLRDSVGAGSCGDEQDNCDCDVNDSGSVTPVDSLLVLRAAVGFATSLSCNHDCQTPGTTLPGQTTTTEQDDQGGGPSTTIQDDDGQGDQGGDGQGDQGGDGQGEDDSGTDSGD